MHAINDNSENFLSEQDAPHVSPGRPDLGDHRPTTTIHSRSTVWLSAFLCSLQVYCLLATGSNNSLAQQGIPGFEWISPIVLFAPTMMTLVSMIRLGEAIQEVEFHQRFKMRPETQYFFPKQVCGILILLVLVPWFQAGWAVIKHLLASKTVYQRGAVEVLNGSWRSIPQICSTTEGGEVCVRTAVDFTNNTVEGRGLLREVLHTAAELHDLKHGMGFRDIT